MIYNKLITIEQARPTKGYFNQKKYVNLCFIIYLSIIFYLFYQMGNSPPQNFQYSEQVPNSPDIPGETKPRRNPCFKTLIDRPKPEFHNMRDALIVSFKNHENLKCYGRLETDSQGKKKIISKTYKEIFEQSKKLGLAIKSLNLIPVTQDIPRMKLEFLGLFSKNRTEWMITDITCIMNGYTSVPLYDTLGRQNIIHILQETNMQACCCSNQCLEILLKLDKLVRLKNIITFDKFSPELEKKASQKKIKLYFYGDLLLLDNLKKIQSQPRKIGQNQILTFCYTSGTTGPPKGALLTHKNFLASITGINNHQSLRVLQTDVYLSYLPLAHAMERTCLLNFICFGGFVIFYNGDTQKIKEDLQVVQPTYFISVPRLFNRFYELINQNFDKAEGIKKCIISKGLETKKDNLMESGVSTHSFYDQIVFSKTKAIFGGRVRVMASGSAPLLPQVHQFMKIIVCAPLIQAYGQTQSTAASFSVVANETQSGHVGGPFSCIQFKLTDIPQMKYFSTDKNEKGEPTPRGEICMRGPSIFLGYYKNQEKTKEALDQNGWLHTGDVGLIKKNGALKIIDRKKNIFKLQQGQYVAPERVQAFCLKYPLLREMFLYGISTESYSVAIITPDKEKLIHLAEENKISGSYEQLCNNLQLKKILLKNLNQFTKKQGLQSFEQPKNIHLESTSFLQKKLLTNTLKLQRFEARLTYDKQIKAMYSQGVI